MSLIKILENDNFIIDYDKENKRYRVSYFEDNHWVDECWFAEYEDKVDNVNYNISSDLNSKVATSHETIFTQKQIEAFAKLEKKYGEELNAEKLNEAIKIYLNKDNIYT